MWSERSQMKRSHSIQFHLYEMSRKDKSIETENRSVVARGWGWETVITKGNVPN